MPSEYLGIVIDYTRNDLLTAQAKELMEEKYCREGEDIQEAFARASLAFASNIDHAQRLYDYVSKLWFMFASPIIFNAPMPGEKFKGLPISCFAGDVQDNLDSLIDHMGEVAWLSVRGGGVGGHWSSIRAVSEKSPGPVPFMQNLNSVVNSYKQGSSRRGSYAAYLDVSHPDIVEFINIRSPTGGDINRKCLSVGFHHAVNITDAFMEAVETDADWNLVCPSTGDVKGTVRARALWESMIETRFKVGEPYMFFIDTANRAMPEVQKAKGLRINGSNLCVAPETLVLTKEGHIPISTLKDKEVEVWNGQEWSSVTIRKTSEDSELIKVTLKDGRFLECTRDHKFYVVQGVGPLEIMEVRAIDLKPNQQLEPQVGSLMFPVQVQSVEETGRRSETYCFTEPKRHRGVFNGILTGQCNEITLPTNEKRTFVCCLSSLNVEYFEEWFGTTIVSDIIEMLDNVLSKFIEQTEGLPGFEKARYSAIQERAVGLGQMGIASLFQKSGVAFDSEEAAEINLAVAKYIKTKADEATLRLGKERGEAPDMIGTGRRNSCNISIAPNANSGLIVGTSPSIEPWEANVFTSKTRIGSHEVRNPYFDKVLRKHASNMDVQDVEKWVNQQWRTIVAADGSVQHLDYLTFDEKNIFKTAREIDQEVLIRLAADRQKYIDQSQSLNLFFVPTEDKDKASKVHYMAWKLGCKGLYYLRSKAIRSVNDISVKAVRNALKDGDVQSSDECESCQG